MATIQTCDCGRRKARGADRCTLCQRERQAEVRAEAEAHLVRGTCPLCASELRRNLALTGWYQCAAYGEPSFREAAYRDKPRCGFQFFLTDLSR